MTKQATGNKKRTKNGATAPAKEPDRLGPAPAAQQRDKIQDAENEIARLKGMMNIHVLASSMWLTSPFAEQLAQAINAQKKAEVAKTEAEKAREDAETAKKEAELRAKTSGIKMATPMISKPRATEMSEGADKLRRAMGLVGDKATYLAILVRT
jgi:hypothetical protein